MAGRSHGGLGRTSVTVGDHAKPVAYANEGIGKEYESRAQSTWNDYYKAKFKLSDHLGKPLKVK